MSKNIDTILKKDFLDRDDLIALLSADKTGRQKIFQRSAEVKKNSVGNKVYFRGLIEFSNICSKNCFYCGIRRGNKNVGRYHLTEKEVVDAAIYAWKEDYASLVIQAGERSDKQHTQTITSILKRIHQETNGEMHITLSLGEQSTETLKEWYDVGAHRYLLRIEEIDQLLYKKLHPNDKHHDYVQRLGCLRTLREIGYQVGTGVMIGLPFQTIENLADDLLFFRDIDIDMAGMGPYIEHEETPLWVYRDQLLPKEERFELSLVMVALLRIIMKDINIAATTAMQAIDPGGREKALIVGANVIMPNLTPLQYREGYLLYEDKPGTDEEAAEFKRNLESSIRLIGDEIGYGEWGDSKHYTKRKS